MQADSELNEPVAKRAERNWEEEVDEVFDEEEIDEDEDNDEDDEENASSERNPVSFVGMNFWKRILEKIIIK